VTVCDDEKRRDYAVGYGRPPAATRFKPGRSGNPKGRRKKPDTIADQLRRALATQIWIEENGRRRKISAQELIIRGIVNDAAKRDQKAIRILLALTDRYGKSDTPTIDAGDLTADDRRLIEQYVSSLQPPPPSSEED
jgi:hypothetical protein